MPLENLRDLGGLGVVGGRIRPSLLWRADDISFAPHWQVSQLHQLGLRTVLDLRSPHEVARSRTSSTARLGLHYHHLALLDQAGDPQALAAMLSEVDTPQRMGQWYAKLFHNSAPLLVLALEHIAGHEGGTIFHCAAGKDRTGILAVAVLSTLGASDEVILDDYESTQKNMVRVRNRLSLAFSSAPNSKQQAPITETRPLLLAQRESMAGLLRNLALEGGPVAVLRLHGLKESTQERLYEKLIDID